MNLDWLDIILFDLAGRPVLLIDLVSSVLGLLCVFLAGRNSKYNFWVGYLYTAALFLLFWNKNLYANLLLQPVSLAINILGHYRWTHPKSSERSSEDHRPGARHLPAGRAAGGFCLGLAAGCALPGRPSPLPGFCGYGPHPAGSAALFPQEVGLLAGVAGGERYPDYPAPERR